MEGPRCRLVRRPSGGSGGVMSPSAPRSHTSRAARRSFAPYRTPTPSLRMTVGWTCAFDDDTRRASAQSLAATTRVSPEVTSQTHPKPQLTHPVILSEGWGRGREQRIAALSVKLRVGPRAGPRATMTASPSVCATSANATSISLDDSGGRTGTTTFSGRRFCFTTGSPASDTVNTHCVCSAQERKRSPGWIERSERYCAITALRT